MVKEINEFSNTLQISNNNKSDGVKGNNGSKTKISNELATALRHFRNGRTQQANNNSEYSAYQLGARSGNTRYIGTDSVQWLGGRNRMGYNSNEGTADGFIGDSKQDRRGDCYLLSEINAIRNTQNGQQILKRNCRKNKDGSYTITLPGAIKARKDYASQGLDTPITGTYTISKEALDKAGKSRRYSNGDLEVVAYELAMEAYRAEMKQTIQKYGKQGDIYTTEGGLKLNSNDVLSSGFMWDAGFVLTGKKSNVYMAKSEKIQNPEKYRDGKYGYITREEMAQRTGADISMYSAKAITEVSGRTSSERDLDNMLNKYAGKEDRYALTFGVIVAHDGQDGATKKNSGHALTVVKITGDTVYVANPWHPEKIEPIPRKDFLKMATMLQAMPVDKPVTLSPQALAHLLSAQQVHKR